MIDEELEQVLNAISIMRLNVVKDEFYIHQSIMKVLESNNIDYHHEYNLAPRNRIDFLTRSGIGIEVKKGKPNAERTLAQIKRYIASPEIKGIILVIERYQDVPAEINGKPCRSIGLRKLWGIASK